MRYEAYVLSSYTYQFLYTSFLENWIKPNFSFYNIEVLLNETQLYLPDRFVLNILDTK